MALTTILVSPRLKSLAAETLAVGGSAWPNQSAPSGRGQTNGSSGVVVEKPLLKLYEKPGPPLRTPKTLSL